MNPAAPARRTVRLITRSAAVKSAVRRAFDGYGQSLSLQVAGEGTAPSGAVDVLVLDLAEGASAVRTIAPVVMRLVPRDKWFDLDRSERTPGRVIARPDDDDGPAIETMAGALVAALRPYRSSRGHARPDREGVPAARGARAGSVAGTATVSRPSSTASTTSGEHQRAGAAAPAGSTAAEAKTAPTVDAHRPGSTASVRSGAPVLGEDQAPSARRVPQRPERARPANIAKSTAPGARGGWQSHTGPAARGGRISPRLLVVGSSTGGPQALMTVFRALPCPLGIPILVVQHMPATFTPMLAEHINSGTQWPCREAQHEETMTADEIRIAPGGYHMALAGGPGATRLELNQDPLVNFCRPAVDVLFYSAARLFGRQTLAVILTGMGADGAAGAKAIRGAGGMAIVQDERTSVVWGMPGAAVRAGAADKVLPIADIAPAISQLVKGTI